MKNNGDEEVRKSSSWSLDWIMHVKIEEYSRWGCALYNKVLRESVFNSSYGMARKQQCKHFILCLRGKLHPMRIWAKSHVTDVVSKGRLRVAMSARISRSWREVGRITVGSRCISARRNGFCFRISHGSVSSVWAPAFLGIFHDTQKLLKSVRGISDSIKFPQLYFCCFLRSDGIGRKIRLETNCSCCFFLMGLLKLSLG